MARLPDLDDNLRDMAGKIDNNLVQAAPRQTPATTSVATRACPPNQQPKNESGLDELLAFSPIDLVKNWFEPEKAPDACLEKVLQPGSAIQKNQTTHFPLPLSAGVGTGQANNSDDVLAIQQRLRGLGVSHVAADGHFGPQTAAAIRLYRTMVVGHETTSKASSAIKPGDRLHQLIQTSAAPRWMRMPASGLGFVNGDRDQHDYGSSTLYKAIINAGRNYHDNYMAETPNAAPITTNDVSKPHGGDTPDHYSHEGGLDLDLRLPKTNGAVGTRVGWADYDRNAAWAMIVAFAIDPQVERIITADRAILQAVKNGDFEWGHKVVDGGRQHRNHIHVDIKPVGLPNVPVG